MQAIYNWVAGGDNNEPTAEERLEEWAVSKIEDEQLEKLLTQPPDLSKVTQTPEHVFKDLEIFESEEGTSLFDSINRTRTCFGHCMLKQQLRYPSHDLKDIQKHQEVIRALRKDKGLADALRTILKDLKGVKEDFLWHWNDETESGELMKEVVYFSLPIVSPWLNRNALLLGANSIYRTFISPAICLLTPLMALIFPYVILRKIGLNVSFMQVFHLLRKMIFTSSFVPPTTKVMAIISTLIWFLFFAQNVYFTIKHARLSHKITGVLHRKIAALSNIVRATQQLQYILKNGSGKAFLPFIDFPAFEDPVYQKLAQSCFFRKYTLFTNKGKVLATYKQLDSVLPSVVKCASIIGKVDMFVSILDYLEEIEQTKKLDWCYLEKGKKHVYRNFWNPVLRHPDKQQPVVNSLPLKNKNHVVLLTGPNAAGKSTFIRTVMLNTILSQSLGIAMAKKWHVKEPFYFLDTYINVPDVEGHASLFEAEMYRCLECLQKAEEYKDKHCMLIMDEVFSSTNYREGFSAAYAVIQQMATKFPHLLGLVTTHFHGLTDLEGRTHGRTRNYCLGIKRVNGEIVYPFKVRKGVCEDHIALELLKKSGFAHSILDVAQEIYQKIDDPRLQEDVFPRKRLGRQDF
jgi:energy-coupling factor transporter ATP-binding protein EcfA2